MCDSQLRVRACLLGNTVLGTRIRLTESLSRFREKDLIKMWHGTILRLNSLICVCAAVCSNSVPLAWIPGQADKLMYQLGKTLNLSTDVKANVTAYALDGFDTPNVTVRSMVGQWGHDGEKGSAMR